MSLRNYEESRADLITDFYLPLSEAARGEEFVSLLTRKKLVLALLSLLLFFWSLHALNNFCLYFLQLAGLWEEKLKEEQTKTGPLEEVCAALREALDAEHKKRMEAFENKMKPIIIKDGPSKKVIY